MKRFSFRLERVRRLRLQAKREAQAALARAHGFARELSERAEDLKQGAERAGQALNAALARQTTVSGSFAREAAEDIEALFAAERRTRIALARARSEIAAREVEFLERKRAYDVLQKLREKKKIAWVAEVERDEQLQLDELHRSRAAEKREEMRLP